MVNEKRLIDANIAIERQWFNNAQPLICRQYAVDVLRDAPTVDAVEVVHGRWEVIEASDELYRCSVCGEWQFIPEEHFAYCPNCGAKMDGGNNNG